MGQMMKAMVYDRYGDPGEVLDLREIPVPLVGPGQVLVKVAAVSINPLDWHYMTGLPMIARLSMGIPSTRRHIPGVDLAGTVAAVGEGVTRFAPGDEVFGESMGGGLAEFVTVAEEGLVSKPENLTFQQAAAVPMAAFTALQGLRDWGRLEEGDDVLVIGASGGIGTFAVQIARAMGAQVTAVCSTSKVETARSLGAQRVIDYTKQDFTTIGERFDVILDIAGTRRITELRRLLAPGGTYVMVSGKKGRWLQPVPRVMLLTVLAKLGLFQSRQGVTRRDLDDLMTLREMLATGRVTPVIDRTYDLTEALDAISYLAEGHARGKVVLTVTPA